MRCVVSAWLGSPIGWHVPARLQILIALGRSVVEEENTRGHHQCRSPYVGMQVRRKSRKVDVCCPIWLEYTTSKLSLERSHFGEGPRLRPARRTPPRTIETVPVWGKVVPVVQRESQSRVCRDHGAGTRANLRM
jgi:hypothetical protein